MKKYLIGLAAGALALGVVLMGGGWVMGAQTSLAVDFFGRPVEVGITGMRGLMSAETAQGSYHRTVSEPDLAAYEDLKIDISLGDVVFREADAFGLEMDWNGPNYDLHYTNENGTLKVWSTSTASIGINLNKSTVTIYLPKGAELRNVNVETDLGSAELRGFTAQDLTVAADLGDVSLSDIELETADLTLNLGDLTTSGFTTRSSLVVEADLGTVELSGAYYGETEVEADLGGVTVYTELPSSEYTYVLEASLGDVRVDGKRNENHLSGGQGNNSIKVYADLGDIELNFG